MNSIVKISRLVAHCLGNVELTTDDNVQVIQYVKKHHILNKPKISNHELINAALSIAENIKKAQLNQKGSIKESFTQENIYDLSQLFGISDIKTLVRLLNPIAVYRSAYIILNTLNSSTYTNAAIKINWQILENNTLSTGTVNIKPINNLVAIQLFPIKFTSISGMYNYKRYTLFIEELISQSMLGYNNVRYHFILDATTTSYNTMYLEMKAIKDNQYYWFNPPIVSIKSFTITMANYVGAINIPITYIYSYLVFTNPLQIYIYQLNELFSEGQTCIFYNPYILNPETPTNSAFITNLTRGTGWPLTIVGSSGFYSIYSIPIDGIVIVAGDRPVSIPDVGITGGSVYIYNINIGTIIPMRLIFMKD